MKQLVFLLRKAKKISRANHQQVLTPPSYVCISAATTTPLLGFILKRLNPNAHMGVRFGQVNPSLMHGEPIRDWKIEKRHCLQHSNTTHRGMGEQATNTHGCRFKEPTGVGEVRRPD